MKNQLVILLRGLQPVKRFQAEFAVAFYGHITLIGAHSKSKLKLVQFTGHFHIFPLISEPNLVNIFLRFSVDYKVSS